MVVRSVVMFLMMKQEPPLPKMEGAVLLQDVPAEDGDGTIAASTMGQRSPQAEHPQIADGPRRAPVHLAAPATSGPSANHRRRASSQSVVVS